MAQQALPDPEPSCVSIAWRESAILPEKRLEGLVFLKRKKEVKPKNMVFVGV